MTEETRECRKCKEVLGLHMFHQKNRDGKLSRHKYCKFCRQKDRHADIRQKKAEKLAASQKAAENWVILKPITAADFIDGETMDQMKRRLGVDISKLKLE